jgi:hypothetical protein
MNHAGLQVLKTCWTSAHSACSSTDASGKLIWASCKPRHWAIVTETLLKAAAVLPLHRHPLLTVPCNWTCRFSAHPSLSVEAALLCTGNGKDLNKRSLLSHPVLKSYCKHCTLHQHCKHQLPGGFDLS